MLTHHEMVALAGSARLMMMADGEISEGELEIAASFAGRLGLTVEQWGAIWEEAIHTLPDDEAVTEAVGALTRPVAREIAYELLYELATDGTIVDPEWDILEWLDEHWRYEDMRRRGKS
ncbi:MAG: TerB family tellurite resistance protein [Myxococcales bacterium]|nr:TerB family tellurite resistance protein [Myxococcales bacterium]